MIFTEFKNLSPVGATLLVAGLLLFVPEDASAQARRVNHDRGSVVRVLQDASCGLYELRVAGWSKKLINSKIEKMIR